MDNLSNNQNIEVIHSDDASKLKEALASIKLPFEIVSVYGLNGRHYAWIIPTVKVQVVPAKKSFKDNVKNKPKSKR